MPLTNEGERLIRANLEQASHGKKPKLVTVGYLTDKQLARLNEERAKRHHDPMKADVVFVGMHIHQRRVIFDGYSIDDVIAQIVSAMSAESIIRMTPKMTAIQSRKKRDDNYGNMVLDEAVLECTGKYPMPELYSVIPKGDDIKPGDKAAADQAAEKGHPEATLSFESLTNPPG
jgi:hypothetical protein